MQILFSYLWRYLVVTVSLFLLFAASGFVPVPGTSAMCAGFSFLWLLRSISKANPRLLSGIEKNLLFATIIILEAIIIPLYAYVLFRQLGVAILAFLGLLPIEAPLIWYMLHRYSDKALIEAKV